MKRASSMEGERRAAWAGGEIHLNRDPDAGGMYGKHAGTWTVWTYSRIIDGRALKHEDNKTFGAWIDAYLYYDDLTKAHARDIAEWALGLSTKP